MKIVQKMGKKTVAATMTAANESVTAKQVRYDENSIIVFVFNKKQKNLPFWCYKSINAVMF